MKRLGILLLALALLACVPTPEADVVVQKDMDAMLEKAKDETEDTRPLREQLGVPDGTYTYTTTAVEQRLTVTVDAPVSVPDTNRLPIIRVRKARFSQELARNTVDYFLQGETVYDMTLPDQPVFDGTIRPYVNGEYGDGSHYYLYVSNKTTAQVSADPSYKSVSAWISATDKGFLENDLESLLYLTYEEGKTVNCFEREVRPADMSSESFLLAKQHCDDYFRAMGISDEIGFGFASEVVGTPFYLLYYTRHVQGLDTYISTTALDYGDNQGYAVPWGYERIAFVADRAALCELHWDNPIEVKETVQERTALLPFSDVMKRFESMVRVRYAATTDDFGGKVGTMEVQIDDIRLSLMRIREQNGDGATGLLVPAWVFYGTSKLTESDGTVSYNLLHGGSSSSPGDLFPVIVINAIDGSVIDFSEGY